MSRDAQLEALKRLPQAPLIPEARMRRWLESTSAIDPDRVDWHIKRAAGFGGSEVGALVMGRRGDPTFFSSPTVSAKSKLLITPPEGPTIHTRRGSELEPFVKQVFERMLRRSGVDWRCREDLRDQVGAAKHPVYDWLRCNVDDFYEIDGDIHLIDFKAPTTATLEHYHAEGGYDEYIYQLHHYELGARGLGIPVKAGCVVMYNYNENDVDCFDVEFDEAKTSELIDAGEHYWRNFVLKGDVPSPIRPEYVVPEGEVPAEIQQAAKEFIEAKLLEGAVSDRLKRARADVEAWVRAQGFLGGDVLHLCNLMQIRSKEILDVEGAVGRLRELGMSDPELDELRDAPNFDPKKLAKVFLSLSEAAKKAVGEFDPENPKSGEFPAAIGALRDVLDADIFEKKGAFNSEKIIDALVSCKVSPEIYQTEVLSSSLPRGKNAELKARKAEVSVEIDQVLEEKTRPEAPALEQTEDFAAFAF